MVGNSNLLLVLFLIWTFEFEMHVNWYVEIWALKLVKFFKKGIIFCDKKLLAKCTRFSDLVFACKTYIFLVHRWMGIQCIWLVASRNSRWKIRAAMHGMSRKPLLVLLYVVLIYLIFLFLLNYFHYIFGASFHFCPCDVCV